MFRRFKANALCLQEVMHCEPRQLLAAEEPFPAADATTTGAIATDAAASSVITTLPNHKFWYDTDGNTIDAHGSTFFKEGDDYYMFGVQRENETKTYDNFFRAVKVYRSQNLVDWEFVRDAVTRADLPKSDVEVKGSRPNVYYDAASQKYVMIMKWKPGYAATRPLIAISDTIDGPYKFHARLETGAVGGDGLHVFQDDDGKNYIVYSEYGGKDGHEGRSLRIDQLPEDIFATEGEGEKTILKTVDSAFVNKGDREGPVLFKVKGVYYILHSGTTGWTSNQIKYQTATSPMGPWSESKKIGNAVGYHSQPNDVLEIQGTEGTTYIYVGDDHNADYLGDSTYVWLPLKFNAKNPEKISLDNYKSFHLDLETGLWSEK